MIHEEAKGGVTQETLDQIVDTLEEIRRHTAKAEEALRKMITLLGSVEGS